MVGKKWLRFGFAKNCGFWFGFGFTKLTAVSGFLVRLGLHSSVDVDSIFHLCFYGMTLEMTYFRTELIQLIVSQPKWLRTRSAEIWHEEKYFDCWSYHAARWTVNKTMWKTVPKLPKSVFWKPNRGNRVFGFWILRSVRFLENQYPTFSSGSAHP